MRISDWSSDVCSSDLCGEAFRIHHWVFTPGWGTREMLNERRAQYRAPQFIQRFQNGSVYYWRRCLNHQTPSPFRSPRLTCARSEEHTSELQSLMRISYAVFCLKKNTTNHQLHIS